MTTAMGMMRTQRLCEIGFVPGNVASRGGGGEFRTLRRSPAPPKPFAATTTASCRFSQRGKPAGSLQRTAALPRCSPSHQKNWQPH